MTHEEMQEFLSSYPRSSTHVVYADIEQQKPLETFNEVFNATFNHPKKDDDLLSIVHGWVEAMQCKYTGYEMYVRVPPEITVTEDEQRKNVYCRIQFAEVVVT